MDFVWQNPLSATSALFCNDMFSNFEELVQTDVIFTDFAKAFDKLKLLVNPLLQTICITEQWNYTLMSTSVSCQSMASPSTDLTFYNILFIPFFLLTYI